MNPRKTEKLIQFFIERHEACEDRAERRAYSDTLAALETLRDAKFHDRTRKLLVDLCDEVHELRNVDILPRDSGPCKVATRALKHLGLPERHIRPANESELTDAPDKTQNSTETQHG